MLLSWEDIFIKKEKKKNESFSLDIFDLVSFLVDALNLQVDFNLIDQNSANNYTWGYGFIDPPSFYNVNI